MHTNGPWTKQETKLHINCLELIAAFNAVRAFTRSSANLRVLLCLDNVTTVAYVNKAGGTRSRELYRVAQRIAAYCEERNISVAAVHVPGALNTTADRLSREIVDSSDWRLDKNILKGSRPTGS